jgi:hypothetical protein
MSAAFTVIALMILGTAITSAGVLIWRRGAQTRPPQPRAATSRSKADPSPSTQVHRVVRRLAVVRGGLERPGKLVRGRAPHTARPAPAPRIELPPQATQVVAFAKRPGLPKLAAYERRERRLAVMR